jgi:putative flippase GtrA
VRKKIIAFIEFFHLPLFQFIPAETFRYLFSGVSTIMVDWVMYSLSYHFIFQKQVVQLGSYAISATNASKAIAIICGFVWGFAMNKYIVFTQSPLRGRQQLFRYGLIVSTCVLLNFFFLNIFIHKIGIFPTPSNILTSMIVAVYSYIVQRSFAFKVTKK